jgi:hypothetical protein
MKAKTEVSSAIQLLDLVWGNTNKATSHSWERLNHSMRESLSMAIGAGFLFAEDDIQYVFRHYNSGRWLGDSQEWIYSEAIKAENKSAIASYEKIKNRVGLIADGVTLGNSRYLHSSCSTRQRERLFVGAEFTWRGVKVKVTSFADDQSYVNACSYKPRKEGEYSDKIDKRFKITREDLIAERAERKERDGITASLTQAATAGASAAAILKAIGVKSKSEMRSVPIEKLRKVAEKFCKAEGGDGTRKAG